MSADNGYIIRVNDEGKYVLQMYFASNDEYPDVNDPGAPKFNTLDSAVRWYNKMNPIGGYQSEYGLTIYVPEDDEWCGTAYTRHGHPIPNSVFVGEFPQWATKLCGGPDNCDACQGDVVHYQQTGYLRPIPCQKLFCENDMSEMKCPNVKTSCLDHCGEDHYEKEENNMDIKKFQRKTFEVEAVRVTDDNINEVATWVGGYVSGATPTPSGRTGRYVKVNVKHPLNDEQTKAHVGNWVLKSEKGFKVYKDRPFKANFDEAVHQNVFTKLFDELKQDGWESAKVDPNKENVFRKSEDDLEELKVVDVKDAVSGAGRNDG